MTTAEYKMNAMLLDLKKKDLLPEGLYKQLCSARGHAPLLYGLPKGHMTGIPLRLIVNFLCLLANIYSLKISSQNFVSTGGKDRILYIKQYGFYCLQ